MTDMPAWMMLLRTVVSLAVVLAVLVFFMRWLERQTSRTRRTPGEAGVAATVLTRTPLGKNVSMQVVRVGKQVLVLGVTEGQVNVLTDLGPADLEQPTIAQDAPAHLAGQPGVGQWPRWGGALGARVAGWATHRHAAERHAAERHAAERQGGAADDLAATLASRQGRHRDATTEPPASPEADLATVPAVAALTPVIQDGGAR